jgi:hypothetical protein
VVDVVVDASGVGDTTSELEGDGKTVVYSVFVTITRDVALDAEGSTATSEPLDGAADDIGDTELSRVAEGEGNVRVADSSTEEGLRATELAVVFAVCRL